VTPTKPAARENKNAKGETFIWESDAASQEHHVQYTAISMDSRNRYFERQKLSY